jgi:hypothetical protein
MVSQTSVEVSTATMAVAVVAADTLAAWSHELQWRSGSLGIVVTAGEMTVEMVPSVRVRDSVLVEVTEPREE